jgi:hypothetical protein
MRLESDYTEKTSSISAIYFSRYASIPNRSSRSRKILKCNSFIKTIKRMEEREFDRLLNLYHPFFAEMMYSCNIGIEELASILGVPEGKCVKIAKDPLSNITIVDIMKIADVLFEDPDNILLNIMQRNLRVNKVRAVDFSKIIEAKAMNEARLRKERAYKIKRSHKEILQNMISKMI